MVKSADIALTIRPFQFLLDFASLVPTLERGNESGCLRKNDPDLFSAAAFYMPLLLLTQIKLSKVCDAARSKMRNKIKLVVVDFNIRHLQITNSTKILNERPLQ